VRAEVGWQNGLASTLCLGTEPRHGWAASDTDAIAGSTFGVGQLASISLSSSTGTGRLQKNPLVLITVAGLQEIEAFLGLDTFGDDVEVQLVTEGDEAGGDGGVAGVVGDAGGEAAVDLQPLHAPA
jgi:hypothetical protein